MIWSMGHRCVTMQSDAQGNCDTWGEQKFWLLHAAHAIAKVWQQHFFLPLCSDWLSRHQGQLLRLPCSRYTPGIWNQYRNQNYQTLS